MHRTNRIRAVIFDVDNTLLASDAYCRETILETLEGLSSEGTRVNPPSEDAFLDVFRRNLPFEKIFQTLFPEQWELILGRYRERAATKPHRATPRACETVHMLLDTGMVVGLVTNREKLLRERLMQIGFDPDQFAFIYQPTDEHKRKPHPSSLDRALDNLLTEHEIHRKQILLVGDHMDDMWAARAHNIDFMAVLQGSATMADFVGHGLDTSCVIDNLGELESALKRRILRHTYRESLTRVSAIDGRHACIGERLARYFSEYALHLHRVTLEVEYLRCLDETFPQQVLPRSLTDSEHIMLTELAEGFSEDDAFAIMEYDHLGRNGIGPTEHDVKSCELWLREKLAGTSLADIIPFIHIFLTSEDVNNLAYKMMMADAVNFEFVPRVTEITDKLARLTLAYHDKPVMGRTHLQPASPTTFGKIFANYLVRLESGMSRLREVRLIGKMNGAVGNYNAFMAACPHLNWKTYSETFVNRLGFEVELFTDQRGPHTDIIRTFQAIQEINNVLRDLATDLSLYAAFRTMYFSKVESHVGSSTMPHKVNPWFAEVAESNTKKANTLINLFATELDVSRLQRDLSDHDFERSYGEALGYVLVAIEHLHIALDLIQPDTAFAMTELEAHPEVVTEAIQTVLRHLGNADAYDQLKNAFRGTHPTFEDIRLFVLTLELPKEIETHLLDLIKPGRYVGLASELARDAHAQYKRDALSLTRVPGTYLYKKQNPP